MNHATRPHVTLDPHLLSVRGWSTSDPAVIAAAQAAEAAGEDLGAWLGRVVVVGANAVTSAATTTDLARIDHALDRLDRQVRASVDGALARLGETLHQATDPETGHVPRAAQAAVDRLATGVQKILTGPGALLPDAAARAVAQVTDAALAEIHRILDQDRQALVRMVAQDRERTAVDLVAAVSTHHAELAGVVDELKQLLADRSAREASRASGPHKGLTYEQAAHRAIADIAAAAGDGGADFTGGSAGVDGSRKGDVVVDLRSLPGPPPRLVVEAKNRPSKQLGAREWSAELDAAIRARSAHVAIGVCPAAQMPTGAPVLLLDQRRMVIAWDPEEGDHVLTAAYLLMRMASGHTGGRAASQQEAEDHLRTITAAMTALDEIQRHASSCRRSAEKITAAAAKACQDLAERIERRDQENTEQAA